MFEIYLDKAKKYRFRLKAKNGENICASQAYKSRSSCMKGIKSVAKNAKSKITLFLRNLNLENGLSG